MRPAGAGRAGTSGRWLLAGSLAAGWLAVASWASAADQYVIVDGPGFGVSLTTPTGGLTVAPAPGQNFTTQATGAIGGVAGDHCGGALHYHGTLFGREDPDPVACGWGKVRQVTFLSAADVAAFATTFELGAQKALTSDPPDFAMGYVRVNDSVSVLDIMRDSVAAARRAGRIDQETADRCTRQIDTARKTDEQALAALRRLRDGTAQPKDREVAERTLRVAIDDKKRGLRCVLKAGLL